MFSAFIHRRPWVAAVVGLLLGPIIGMLYLGAGTKAVAYAAIWISIYGLPLLVAHAGLLPVDAETVIAVLVVSYRIGGAVHCERVARRRVDEVPTAWFARWYAVVALGMVLPAGMRLLVWEPFNMPSASMEPSLQVGDYLIAEKLPYLLREPRRGDLIVFLSPRDDTVPYVKRLVGLPGDRVQMNAGALHLNGAAVPREVTLPNPAGFEDDWGTIYRETVPEGASYLVREISDLRPFDETEVEVVPPGHYFVLGDNRDNSLDSRNDIGFVPHENLIGRVGLILWNSKAQRLRLIVAD